MGRMWDEKMETLWDEPKVVSGYGTKPQVLRQFVKEFPEFMFYLYLPVKLAGHDWNYDHVPSNLKWLQPLLNEVDVEQDDYVYITAKNMWFERGQTYNREGWHSDGFMSEDINYIWSDGPQTQFLFGDFDLTQDHEISLKEMAKLTGEVKKVTPFLFVKMDEKVIHRPPPVLESGTRGFVKISVSKSRYNLKGNSHNHLLDYSWDMCKRRHTRNDPVCMFNK